MPSPFAITAATNAVPLDNNRQGQTSFTVSNMTSQALRGRGHVVAQPTSAGPWLKLLGEAERDFAASGSQQYVVQITVPLSASAGDYTFRLDMVDVANPDDNFSEGPTVKFVVAPAPPPVKKPFPWWIVAVAVGVLILVGGGTYGIIQLLHKTPTALLSQWQSSPSMSTSRGGVAATLGPDGLIYAIGGSNGLTNGNSSGLNTVEAYDPKTKNWVAIPSMPTSRLFLAAVTGPDGRIYAIGGFSNNSALNTVEVYDPKTRNWASLAPLPTARYALAAVVGPDGRIYAIGGYTTSSVNTVEVYDPNTKNWASLAPMHTARAALGAVLGPDGRIYAIGGIANSNGLNAVEAYDPKTNSWTDVTSMPTARYGLAAVLGPDGRIYAIGGIASGNVLKTVEVYDPTSKNWSTVTSMSTARWGLAAVLGPDGRIYAIGGGSNGTLSPLNTVEIGYGGDWLR